VTPAEWKRIDALEEAARRAMPAPVVIIVNDPEDSALLTPHRRGNNDPSKTIQIGSAEFLGAEWYAACQEAERSGGRPQ
jgi:hypothetical protein